MMYCPHGIATTCDECIRDRREQAERAARMTAAKLSRQVSDALVALHEYRTFVLSSAESVQHEEALDGARAGLVVARSYLSALALKMGDR